MLQCEKSAVKGNHVYNLQQREESVFLGLVKLIKAPISVYINSLQNCFRPVIF